MPLENILYNEIINFCIPLPQCTPLGKHSLWWDYKEEVKEREVVFEVKSHLSPLGVISLP